MRQRTLALKRVCLTAATLLLLQACGAAPLRKSSTPPPAPPATVSNELTPGQPPQEDPQNVLGWALTESDRTLKGALERWANTAGWRLFWELGVDYRIDAQATVKGSFEEAVAAVMKNMEHADVPPKAIFYRGNGVLRVVARGME